MQCPNIKEKYFCKNEEAIYSMKKKRLIFAKIIQRVCASILLIALTGCQNESSNESQPLELSMGLVTSSSAIVVLSNVFTLDQISKYEIYLDDSLLIELENANYYEISDLPPNTTFYGYVVAVDKNVNQQQTASFSFVTKENSAPEEFFVQISQVTGHSMNLTWEEPYDADRDEITFDLLLDNSPIVENLTNTAYSIPGLSPSSRYSLIIIAKDGYGNSSEQSMSFNTPASGAEISYKKEEFFGVDREYGIFLPSSSDTKMLPLVINLHGWSGIVWPEMMNDYFVELGEKEQFIFMAPQGRIGEDGYSFWDHQVDIDFLVQLIDSVCYRHQVDPERIYVLGHSNGAFMTFYLAQAIESKLSAIGAIAGTVHSNFTFQQPMPLCYVHGTADATVSYYGGAHIGVDKLIELFISNNQLNPSPTVVELPNLVTEDNTTVTEITHATLNVSSGDLVHYRINNGNHLIPGISRYTNNHDINAYDKFWQFFKTRKLSDK